MPQALSKSALGLTALCLVAGGLSFVRRAHVVPREVFARAVATVQSDYRAGDLVVVLPYSQMTPRLLFGDASPSAEPGEARVELIELRTIEPERLRDYRRLWLFDVGAIGRSQRDVDAVSSVGDVSVLQDESGLRLLRIDVEHPHDPPRRRAWRR